MPEHRGRNFWVEKIEAQSEGHLSVPKFCESNHLVLKTFRSWRQRLKDESLLKTQVGTNTLVELKVKNEPPVLPAVKGPAFFEVILDNGVIFRWPLGTDPAYVAETTTAVLESRC
jgi:hypothetical protein